MPLVSIIIPCYNAAGFVGDAISSALAQTHPDTEVIVVDDGSVDESVAVIKQFGDRVRLVTGPNAGGSRARNKGLELARGEFIQFLDADDVLHPRKIECQVDILLSTGDDAVYSDWNLSELHRPERTEICKVEESTTDSVVLALNPQNIQTDAPLHRRGALESIGGFRVDLPCCQERDLMLRLACQGGARFSRLPGVLHTVRLHSAGVSANELRVLQWMKPLLEEAFAYLRERRQLTDARRWAFACLMARQGRVLFRYRKRKEAREYFSIAARMHPDGWRSAFKPASSLMVRVVGPEFTEEMLRPVKAASRLLQPLYSTAVAGRSEHVTAIAQARGREQ